jgi:hypothetical protein
MRSFRLLFAALIGLVTVAAFSPAPASAAVPVPSGARITCDTSHVTAGLHFANWSAGRSVTATFTVASAQVITATSTTYPSYIGQSTTVTGAVAANGTIDLVGYTRAWNPAAYLSYYETVRLYVAYADTPTAGTLYTSTCYYDPRNSYALTCGGVAGNATFALTVTGTRATAGGTNDPGRYPTRVIYRQFTDSRSIGGLFTRHAQEDDVSRRIVRDGDNWSDPGIGRDLSNLELFVDQIEVLVNDGFGNRVGGAKLVCSYEL